MPSRIQPYELEIQQGSAFKRVFVFPFSLAGFSARAMVRVSPDAPDPPKLSFVFNAAAPAARITISGSTLTMQAGSSVTNALAGWTDGVWDLELLPGAVEEDAQVWLRGPVRLVKQVTR
jgi:hypothetical protein